MLVPYLHYYLGVCTIDVHQSDTQLMSSTTKNMNGLVQKCMKDCPLMHSCTRPFIFWVVELISCVSEWDTLMV